MIRRGWIAVAAALVITGGVGWVVARVVSDNQFADSLDRAKFEARTGNFEKARTILLALPTWRLADPVAGDLLATAEHAAGHYEEALAAWSRIPPGSPNETRVALATARTLVGNLGRFADAEVILEQAAKKPGPLRLEVCHSLSQLYFLESRPEAMRRLIHETEADWRDPTAEIRDLWLIDDATVLIDDIRGQIKKAESLAPNDDRVWLAQANLAILEERFDEASRKLDDCLRNRPTDPAVWLSRLKLARARNETSRIDEALAHLPADIIRESDLLELRASLAAIRKDPVDQRQTLERRIEVEPADPGAFESLAILAWEAGQKDRAVELRRRKTELDGAKDRYRRLLSDRVPLDRLDELAQLAETLNRPFEARGWWSLACQLKPADSTARQGFERLQKRLAESTPALSGTLADRLAHLLPSDVSKLAVTPLRAGQDHSERPLARFIDDSEAAHLRFVFENGRSPQRQLPETTSGGVGVIDIDGDGWLDVYLVQGGTFPPDPSRPHAGDVLYRNRGDGTFEDVTESSGIARMPRGYGQGVAVGDVDNDGDPDLLITRWRSYALYRNRGDGTFEDATEPWDLGGDRDWPTSAAFADLDNDGDLDLYVAHYVAWDAQHPKLCPIAGTDTDQARLGYCMPHTLTSSADHLFRNDGGRFVDITAEAGIVDRDGRGLGVVAADVNDDGKVDLFVANDTTANYLFMNHGNLKFEEAGLSSGVACNASGAYQAGMGTAAGDLDGDGRIDLFVTNFYGESTTFYQNLGGGMFGDGSALIGLAAPSRFLLGFGIVLLDANNDGWLDIATANGHVNDERPKFPYAMPAQLLLGDGKGRVIDASKDAGAPWQVPRVARGLASADLDNDGKVDLLLISQDGPLAYFHNQSEARHWVTLGLSGTVSSREGVGARVLVKAGKKQWLTVRTGGGSFESASDPRLHVGLGRADRIDEIEIRWPSGQVDRHQNLAVDQGYLLVEGAATTRSLPGFERPR